MMLRAALVVLIICASAAAEEPAAPSSAPGLALSVAQAHGGPSDAFVARLIALNVPAGTPPSALTPPGPFKATWEGFINLRIRGTYSFSAEGSGSFKLMINPQPVLGETGATGPSFRLNKGANRIRLEYQSPTTGDAVIRLYWSEKGYPREPIPPTVLTHYASDAGLQAGLAIRQGRDLFLSLRCIRCHDDPQITNRPVTGADSPPELAQDAPDLSRIPFRLNQNWIAAWIANPSQFNPRAQMPRLFAGDANSIPQQAADVAAFLVQPDGSAPKTPAPPPPDETRIKSGARTYLELGCIACHTPPEQASADTLTPPRVPHRYVRAKYNYAALAAFLKSPHALFQWIRMPDFHLTDEETQALAQYLYYKSSELDATPPPGDPQRGRALLASAGCLSCHVPQVKMDFSRAPSLGQLIASDWTDGCLAEGPNKRGRAPDFSFSQAERNALGGFASRGLGSLSRDTPPDFARRQVAELNCVACHDRDGQESVWSSLEDQIKGMLAVLGPGEADSGKYSPDQSRPVLTWTGEKLRLQWMDQFIAGKIDYKPRPWLRARMPSFPGQTRELAAGLALEHGFPAILPPPPPAAPAPPPDPKLAEIGRKLAGKDGGFSCVQCHAVADQKALAPFEAPAPNFAHIAERLNKEYYMRWMLKPQRVQPGTKMPDFADAEGKTARTQYFDGDARQQFEAIWQYLLAGHEIQPP
jgi:mono/diheme cytochrome c family protein